MKAGKETMRTALYPAAAVSLILMAQQSLAAAPAQPQVMAQPLIRPDEVSTSNILMPYQ
ncbi:MAG: hypothetical protein HY272_11775 [Gammaproteobacteria bacterium]|nr:hypothetical protein [Gammaproteobacteria bacterium]